MTTALQTAFSLPFLSAKMISNLALQGIGVFSTAALSGEDFTLQPWSAIAVRGNNGSFEIYAYDAVDTTTADDAGVSCIVVSGRRYKKRVDVLIKDAAISATVSAQPASPALGDTYIVPAAPTGTDWASQAKTVATWTARGWIFRQPFVGMLVYSAAVDGFYTYTSGGVWSQGLPIGAIADGSIVQEKLLDAFYTVYVESVLNTPPGGTPTNNTRYQVGLAPTGAFTGHANAIARWNSAGAGAWVFIAPVEGSTIYRRDVAVFYSYRSGTWEATSPRSAYSSLYSKAGTIAAVTTINSTTPTNLVSQAITVAAGIGTHIKVSVGGLKSSAVSIGASSNPELGVRIDSASTLAVIFDPAIDTSSWKTEFGYFALIPLPDNSAHTYSLSMRRPSGVNSSTFTNIDYRVTFEVVTVTP